VLAELQDHYEDLQDEAQHAGLSHKEAAADAAQRLGDTDRLAARYLQCPELTASWSRLAVVQYCVTGHPLIRSSV